MEAIIRKYLEGKASEEEQSALIAWLEEKENQQTFKEIKSRWKSELKDSDLPLSTLGELDKFQIRILGERALEVRKLGFVRRLYRYAALILLLVSLGSISVYFLGRPSGGSAFYNTVIAENGQMSKVLLPDSTMVWLNSGSRVRYSSDFGKRHRALDLTGQAYFVVTRNKDLPFEVSCDEVKVKVTGTRFTAESYPGDPTISVVLEEGSVELLSSGEKVLAHLHPDEMIVYNKPDSCYRIEKVSAKRYSSWKDGMINVYDLPLKTVAMKLERKYNQIIKVDKELEDYKVTFSIRNEDFKEVLEMLIAITPARVYHKGEIIYLKAK